MFREVDKRTAVLAALEGKLVLQYSGDRQRRNGECGECIYNLTEALSNTMLEGDRYILDDPDPEAVVIKEGATFPAEELKEAMYEAQAVQIAPQVDQKPIKPDQSEAKPDQAAPEANQTPPPAKNKPGPKPVDAGKIKALHAAGWDIDKIADEMGCSVTTVKRYL